MAAATYVSPVINTAAKRDTAYDDLATLIQHIRLGTGGYTMDLTSVVLDQVTHLITIILTAPLPNQVQVDRYHLTQTA